MAAGQYSYLLLRCYLDSRESAQKLALDVLKCRHYAFIVHDKDIWHDSNEEHNEGEPKKAHYHFVLNLSVAASCNAVRNKVLAAFPKCGAYVQIPQDGEASVDYLTHSTPKAIAEKKYRYPVEDVVSDDYAYFRSAAYVDGCKEQKTDISDEFVNTILEMGYLDRATLKAFSDKGGKAFRYNYRKDMQFCCDVLACSMDMLFFRPETRWGMQQTRDSLRKDLDYLDENRKAMIKELTVAVVSNVTEYMCQKVDNKSK